MKHTPLSSAIYPVHHPSTRLLLPLYRAALLLLIRPCKPYGRPPDRPVRNESDVSQNVSVAYVGRRPRRLREWPLVNSASSFLLCFLCFKRTAANYDEGGQRHARRVVDAPHNAQRNLDAVGNAASTQVQRKNFLPSAATARRSTSSSGQQHRRKFVARPPLPQHSARANDAPARHHRYRLRAPRCRRPRLSNPASNTPPPTGHSAAHCESERPRRAPRYRRGKSRRTVHLSVRPRRPPSAPPEDGAERFSFLFTLPAISTWSNLDSATPSLPTATQCRETHA